MIHLQSILQGIWGSDLYTKKLPNLEHWTSITTPQKSKNNMKMGYTKKLGFLEKKIYFYMRKLSTIEIKQFSKNI